MFFYLFGIREKTENLSAHLTLAAWGDIRLKKVTSLWFKYILFHMMAILLGLFYAPQ